MTRRLLRACWCAALLAPLGLAARGSAKPPDLPLESQNDVRPQLIDPDAAGAEDAAAAFGIVPPTTRLRSTDFTPVPLLPPIQVQKAPTGKLRFGIGVNSDIGLTGSIIVAQACDSPCEPAVKRRELLPAPSLYRLRPSVRRHVAESLLFSVHPLMTLMPTDKLLDCPSDHPQVSATDVLLERMCEAAFSSAYALLKPDLRDLRNLDEVIALKRCWEECQIRQREMPQLQRRITDKAMHMGIPLHVWSLSRPDCTQLVWVLPDADQTAPQQQPPTPPCSACPGMCPRPAERHVYQFTAPDLTQDLMHNLEKLETAHRLMHLAEHLALSGQVCEALDCFDIVCRMCPGRFEAHVAEIMAQVFSPVYSGSTEDAEDGACEELPAPKEEPEAKSGDKEREIERKLNAPVSVTFTDMPLRQIIDDIRAWNGINIYIDEPAVIAEGIRLDHPISIKLEKVALKSVLRLILKEAHLTYVIRDEVLQITTPRHARRKGPTAGYAAPHDDAACPSACPKCERLHAAHAKGVHEQVEGLMQACRLAAEAGRHAKAAELARQAYALDAERVMADPLVYKMHLLALKRDKGKARRCPPDGGAEECEPACPRTEDCPTPNHEVPPPVDGGIVGALEQVLEEAEAPHHTGLSLHGRHFDVDCSWTGLRMQGQVPLHGSLYTLQFRNGAFSGWVTADPAAR